MRILHVDLDLPGLDLQLETERWTEVCDCELSDSIRPQYTLGRFWPSGGRRRM